MTKRNVFVAAIDTQSDFVMKGGRLPVKGAEELIEAMAAYIATLDPEEIAGFLATFDTHDLESFIGSPENLGDPENGITGFDIHCEKGTPGWENVLNLQIVKARGIPVYTLEKDVFDMWAKPNFCVESYPAKSQIWKRDFFFEELKRKGVDTIRVFGFASDFCVMWAIRGFIDRGFKVEVVGSLTAGILRDIERTVADEFPGQVTII